MGKRMYAYKLDAARRRDATWSDKVLINARCSIRTMTQEFHGRDVRCLGFARRSGMTSDVPYAALFDFLPSRSSVIPPPEDSILYYFCNMLDDR